MLKLGPIHRFFFPKHVDMVDINALKYSVHGSVEFIDTFKYDIENY